MKKCCDNCGNCEPLNPFIPVCEGCVFIQTESGKVPSNWKPIPPKNNADRIRAMSDEELAEYLLDVEQGNFTIDCCDDRFCDTQNCCHNCTEAAIKWLKQPAESDVVK